MNQLFLIRWGERNVNDFFNQVYSIVEQIPFGKVASYGQIARMLGKPHGSREVGRAMHCCPEGLPWHRVVMKDGTIASRLSADIQHNLLEAEGVVFMADGRVNMAKCACIDETL